MGADVVTRLRKRVDVDELLKVEVRRARALDGSTCHAPAIRVLEARLGHILAHLSPCLGELVDRGLKVRVVLADAPGR